MTPVTTSGGSDVSGRDVVLLGTASQVPTRERAHHATLLRFDGHGVLLDPGEGAQRQLTLAGIAASTIRRICITHAHGDHCLGLPGVLQRLSLDGVGHPIDVHAPREAMPWIERLRHASVYDDHADIRLHPTDPGVVATTPPLHVRAAALEHAIPALGWRFDEPPGRTLDPVRAAAAGVNGPARTELLAEGRVTIDGRTVHLDDVSAPRHARSMAFVMDTRDCAGARELAERVDLLVIEATFLTAERELAEVSGHLTAAQAASIGREAGARRIVLTHVSQRYPDLAGHREEAHLAAPDADLHVARDLDVVGFPPR
jgi:ribonuclease Z